MFLNSDYNDLMTPDPETGEESGLSRFLSILVRQCGALLKVNLLFLLGCVPVVTIPLSLFIMNRAVLRMVQDQKVNCFQLCRDTVKQSWKQSYLAFFVTALPLGFAGYGMQFYLGLVSSSPLFFLPFVVCSTIFLVALLSAGCLYALLDSGKSLNESARLALPLGVTNPLRTVPAALCCCGLPLFAVLCLPFSGLYLLLVGFSFPCLIGNFLLRVVLAPWTDTADDGDSE